MIAEYERYHGVVLREVVVRASVPIQIAVNDEYGRINSFCLNDRLGLHIKHSAKRLPPWQFTFDDDIVLELRSLESAHGLVWVALVCGHDGIVGLSLDEFWRATQASDGATRFIRVDRDRHTMYRVYGNAGRFPAAKPRGLAELVDLVVGQTA